MLANTLSEKVKLIRHSTWISLTSEELARTSTWNASWWHSSSGFFLLSDYNTIHVGRCMCFVVCHNDNAEITYITKYELL